MILINRRMYRRSVLLATAGSLSVCVHSVKLSTFYHLVESVFYSNSIYVKVFWNLLLHTCMLCIATMELHNLPTLEILILPPVHMSMTNTLCLIAMDLKTLTVKPSPKIWVDSSSKFALACSPFFKKKVFHHLQYLNRSLQNLRKWPLEFPVVNTLKVLSPSPFLDQASWPPTS